MNAPRDLPLYYANEKLYIYPCPREKPTKKLKENIPCERKEKSIKKRKNPLKKRKKESVSSMSSYMYVDRTKEKEKEWTESLTS